MRGKQGLLLLFLLAAFTVIAGCTSEAPSSSSVTNKTTFRIAGKVTSSGTALQDVTVTLSSAGSATATVTTDASGAFSFPELANGIYTITPSKTGYAFTPTSSEQTVNNSEITNVTFIVTYSVSGTVMAGGAGLAGVTVQASSSIAESAVTDSNGGYTIHSLENGSYTLTAAKSGYAFTSAVLDTTINNANITGKDFTVLIDPSGGNLVSHWMGIPQTASYTIVITGDEQFRWHNQGVPDPVGYTGTKRHTAGTRTVAFSQEVYQGIICTKKVVTEKIKIDSLFNDAPMNPPSIWNATTLVNYLARGVDGVIYQIGWGLAEQSQSSVDINPQDPNGISIADAILSPERVYAAQPYGDGTILVSTQSTTDSVDLQGRNNHHVVTSSTKIYNNQSNGADNNLIMSLATRTITDATTGSGYTSRYTEIGQDHLYWKPGAGDVDSSGTVTGNGDEHYPMPDGTPVNGISEYWKTITYIRQ